jgi:HPt (histidine-containing phosphotransfer) domain-containing protein
MSVSYKYQDKYLHGAGMAGTPFVFDFDRFAANTMNDDALQREVMGLFLDQVKAAKARLREGTLSAYDSKFLGHTLRGAAAAVGAGEIEEIGASWEKMACDVPKLALALEVAEESFLLALKRAGF